VPVFKLGLGLGHHVVGRLRSGVSISDSFQIFALIAEGDGNCRGGGDVRGEYVPHLSDACYEEPKASREVD